MIQHRTCDVAVIGAGAAGLAAAAECARSGLVALAVDREEFAGGILRQCIHNGFGLRYFKEELTGPEYARRVELQAKEAGAEFALGHTVSSIERREDGTFTLTTLSAADGVTRIDARAVILAMGCRERNRGNLAIPGTRPAGIFTAGSAQKLLNMEGMLPGRSAVIVGSGDIGLIMARRMTLEGAKVLACVELMPYSSGLNRNIVQCLHDYNIPLYLSHTVTKIEGEGRLTGVTVQKVDENRAPVPGTEMHFDCDTLLLSVGLIPENELSGGAGVEMDRRHNGPMVYENMETSVPGIFAAGNVVHVHDLVDFVTGESQRAGAAAARFARQGPAPEGRVLEVENGASVTYTVPGKIRLANVDKAVEIFFRVNRVCGNSVIRVTAGSEQLAAYKREHLAPGEMERISVPRALLEKADGCITVSVEEA